MGVLKACYSLDMLVEGENVPHFITKSNSENTNNSFLSRPSEIQNTIDIINGIRNNEQTAALIPAFSRSTTPSETGSIKGTNQEPDSAFITKARTHHSGPNTVRKHVRQSWGQVLKLGESVASSNVAKPLNSQPADKAGGFVTIFWLL